MRDAFPDRTRQHVIAPGTRPSLAVQCEIGRHDTSSSPRAEIEAGTFFPSHWRPSRSIQIERAVTGEAVADSIHQVASTSKPFRSLLELAIS